MSMCTEAPIMTPEERAATEAFRQDLLTQFNENAAAMWYAKGRGDKARYEETVEETRRLYREIREVEAVLVSGHLPF